MERDCPNPALSADTSRDAERLLFEHYGTLEPWEKVRIMCELGALMEDLSKRSIRERYPEATEREVNLRFAALRFGPDLVRRVWGWDPSVEGW